MPRNNEEFIEYQTNKAKAGGYNVDYVPRKRSQIQTNFFIDEQTRTVLDKPEKPKVVKTQTEKHCLEYDKKEEARNHLMSKHCTKNKRMGHKAMAAIEQDELKRRFVIEEESDSKDEEENKENKRLTCWGCAVMKAMDDALLHGEVIQSKVTEG
jgi:hypothetical protein